MLSFKNVSVRCEDCRKDFLCWLAKGYSPYDHRCIDCFAKTDNSAHTPGFMIQAFYAAIGELGYVEIRCSDCQRSFHGLLSPQDTRFGHKCPHCFTLTDDYEKTPPEMATVFYYVWASRLISTAVCARARAGGEEGHEKFGVLECLECRLRSLQNADGTWSSGIYIRSVGDIAQEYGVTGNYVADLLEQLSNGTCHVLTGK